MVSGRLEGDKAIFEAVQDSGARSSEVIPHFAKCGIVHVPQPESMFRLAWAHPFY
jgi:hypothetical protein